MITDHVPSDLRTELRAHESASPPTVFTTPIIFIMSLFLLERSLPRPTGESIFDTFKGQLDLERHDGRTIAGVCARISQRILALTAAIWHNDLIGAPVLRSLTAYDH